MIVLLVGGVLLGCGQHATDAAASATSDPLIQKLNAMPASQRGEYAKAHMDEVMKAASQPGAPGVKGGTK